MASSLNRGYHGLQVAYGAEKNQRSLQGRQGIAWRDSSLTSVAIAEAAHKLTPEERAALLTRLENQNKLLRRFEVD